MGGLKEKKRELSLIRQRVDCKYETRHRICIRIVRIHVLRYKTGSPQIYVFIYLFVSRERGEGAAKE